MLKPFFRRDPLSIGGGERLALGGKDYFGRTTKSMGFLSLMFGRVEGPGQRATRLRPCVHARTQQTVTHTHTHTYTHTHTFMLRP